MTMKSNEIRVKNRHASIFEMLAKKRQIIVPIDRQSLFYLGKVKNKLGKEKIDIKPMAKISIDRMHDVKLIRRTKNYKVFQAKPKRDV